MMDALIFLNKLFPRVWHAKKHGQKIGLVFSSLSLLKEKNITWEEEEEEEDKG